MFPCHLQKHQHKTRRQAERCVKCAAVTRRYFKRLSDRILKEAQERPARAA